MKHQLNIISKQTYCYNKSMKVMKCETERALTERREHEWNELLLIGRMRRKLMKEQ